MTRLRIGVLFTAGLLLSLGFSGVSRGEDGIIDDLIIFGADVLPKTRPNSLLAAIPGGTFVITVAHIPPSLEDAVVNRRPAECKPAQFRVDMLRVQSADGQVEVELGERQSLEAGEAARIVHQVPDQGAYGIRSYDLDLMGFRFRAGPPSPRCNLVASGLFYPDPHANMPVQFSLIPSDGSEPKGRLKQDPDER